MPRAPLQPEEAVLYFHGAERASGAIRKGLDQLGVDAEPAAAIERLAARYRQALERTIALPPDDGPSGRCEDRDA